MPSPLSPKATVVQLSPLLAGIKILSCVTLDSYLNSLCLIFPPDFPICWQGSMAPGLYSGLCLSPRGWPLLNFHYIFVGLVMGRLYFRLSSFLLDFPGDMLVPSLYPIPFLDFLGFCAPLLAGLFPRVVSSTSMVGTFASDYACLIVLLHLGSIAYVLSKSTPPTLFYPPPVNQQDLSG